MKSIAFLVAIFGLATAQRDLSLSVVEVMSRLPPAYRELQDFVVNAVANAKLNSSAAIYDLHNEIYTAKDTFLRSAINLEANTLLHLNNQNVQVDAGCLDLLRNSVDLNLQVAGVGFTNCIVVVDSKLNSELDLIYDQLQVNESAYIHFSLYDAFRGQNIFQNPQAIIDRLQEKLNELQQVPTELVDQLNALVDLFRVRLDVIRATYRQCLTVNNQVYQTAVDLVLIQLQQICGGSLVPPTTTSTTEEPPTTVPFTDTTPAPSPPSVQPDTVGYL